MTTGSRGAAANPAGLNLGRVLAWLADHGSFGDGYPHSAALTSEEALQVLDYDVAVELTPLDIRGPAAAAIGHLRTALARGGHVITCNKGPLGWAWRPPPGLAPDKGVPFPYQTTAVDGRPVFSPAH